MQEIKVNNKLDNMLDVRFIVDYGRSENKYLKVFYAIKYEK